MLEISAATQINTAPVSAQSATDWWLALCKVSCTQVKTEHLRKAGPADLNFSSSTSFTTELADRTASVFGSSFCHLSFLTWTLCGSVVMLGHSICPHMSHGVSPDDRLLVTFPGPCLLFPPPPLPFTLCQGMNPEPCACQPSILPLRHTFDPNDKLVM